MVSAYWTVDEPALETEARCAKAFLLTVNSTFKTAGKATKRFVGSQDRLFRGVVLPGVREAGLVVHLPSSSHPSPLCASDTWTG
ncbi:hypothetical protein M407DRAFT_23267 [Tulasnella calospora MUT 4182]|uniref:Uncharacterized protein n=1 Tax=Tulasnella calospora MUT 4182 TaxID=1051891 RepID=A0A0C3L163_9AGAM|nr:hypothetical protein M407DRAFT_23267 [Tulasnella calospora MUT 4182]